mgnify:CR=1 FL=1
MFRNRLRRLSSEILEDRTVLAGDVSAVLIGDSLSLVGDAQNNQLYITRISATQIKLESGQSATTVNGQNAPVVLDFAQGGKLTINMRGGDDEIHLGWSNMAMELKTLSINMGAGTDLLTLEDVDVQATSATNISMGVDGSTDFNGINVIGGCSFAGDVNITARGTQSSVHVFHSSFAKNLSYQLGAGADIVWMGQDQVAGKVWYKSSLGNNYFKLQNSQVGSIDFDGGSGDETIELFDVRAASADLRMFGGKDSLDIDALAKADGPIAMDDLYVDMGSGDDTIMAGFVTAADARFILGSGANTANLGFNVFGKLRVDGGAQADYVALNYSAVDELTGFLGGGDDDVAIHKDMTVKVKLTLNGGTGDNTLLDDGLTLPSNPANVNVANFTIV